MADTPPEPPSLGSGSTAAPQRGARPAAPSPRPSDRRRRGAYARDLSGERIGYLEVDSDLGNVRGVRTLRGRCCHCGERRTIALWNALRSTACQGCPERPGRKTRPTLARRVGRLRRAANPELARELVVAGDRAPQIWADDAPESVAAVAELVGLVGPLSLDEVGALLGVSRERARQIEANAIRRARIACRRLGLGWRDLVG